MQLPLGPYPNVKNTGAFMSESGTNVASAFCWDGDVPGIAVVDHSDLTFAKVNLPDGISDPDIVFGAEATKGVVAYTINEEIRYQTFAYSNGQINLDPPVFLAIGIHPNIDKQHDCGENVTEDVVLVFDNLNQDIEYSEGNLNGNFNAPNPVPATSGPNNTVNYDQRLRPDVAFLGKQAPGTLIFTYVGEDNGNYYVHTDRMRPGPTTSVENTQQSPALVALDNTHPRIDGVLNWNAGSLDYYYQVVYHTENKIYEANNDEFFTITYQQGNKNEFPAVAYSGDHADIIWVTDNLPGSTLEILGKEFFEGTPNPDLKALTANPNASGGGSGGCASSGDNIVPSIDGHCGGVDEYIAFWYNGNSQSLRFKFAKSEGADNYKRGGGQSSPSKAPNLLPEYINRGNFTMPEYPKDYQMDIFNLSGQLVAHCHLSDFKRELSGLKSGSYVLIIGTGAEQRVQKLLLQ